MSQEYWLLAGGGGGDGLLFGVSGGIARLTQSSHMFSNDLIKTTLHVRGLQREGHRAESGAICLLHGFGVVLV